jgi:hypothetical protein
MAVQSPRPPGSDTKVLPQYQLPASANSHLRSRSAGCAQAAVPVIALLAWEPLDAVTLAMVVLLVAVFPTGMIAGRWRRLLLWSGTAAVAANVLASLVRPRLSTGDGFHPNPIGIAAAGSAAGA